MKQNKSFTLIEILVVIVIIGILAGIIFVSMTSAINAANDGRRKADIANFYSSIMARGISESYPVFSGYIDINDTSASSTTLKNFINTYLATIPIDPKNTDNHKYYYTSDGTGFAVVAVLENGTCFIKKTSESIFNDSACTALATGESSLGDITNLAFSNSNSVLGGSGSLLYAIDSMKGTGNGNKSATTSYATIPVEYLEYGNTTYSTSPTLGDTTADNSMLAIRYNGNLTIDSGAVLTPQVRKKGMFLFIEGNLTINNGSISMTAKGAKDKAGDHIFILSSDETNSIALSWTVATGSNKSIIRRQLDSSPTSSTGTEVYNGNIASFVDTGLTPGYKYCYSVWGFNSMTGNYSTTPATGCETLANYEIPANGGAGGDSVSGALYENVRYYGKPGLVGINGQTGGGGSGAAFWGATSGSGSTGTSYSGGSGGGASCFGGTAMSGVGNGGAGGNAVSSCAGGNSDAGGGAGNLGGSTAPGATGNTVPGESGTGGLLIIYANNIVIGSQGVISVDGKNGAHAGIPGGSSGGGSVNIFYDGSFTNAVSNDTNITANGGAAILGNGAVVYGGAGGNGTVRRVKVSN